MADSSLFDMLNRFRPYFSPSALKVIDWKRLIAEVFKRHPGPVDLGRWAAATLPPSVALADSVDGTELARLPAEAKEEAGDRVLELYFNSLANDEGMHLDFTPTRFREQAGIVTYRPRFWRPLDDGFRRSLLKVYAGFYRGPESLLDEGLRGTGLIPAEVPPETAVKLKRVLRDHFHVGEKVKVAFTMEHFEKSFHDLFSELREARVTLPVDFAFLGIVLAGLYVTLGGMGTAHEVKKIYDRSKASDERLTERISPPR